MITQLQWIIVSSIAIYLMCAAWVYGYVYTKSKIKYGHFAVDQFDSIVCGVFFPIYILCHWILAPVAAMEANFSIKRQEKKLRVETQEKLARIQLEEAEKELDQELNNKAA